MISTALPLQQLFLVLFLSANMIHSFQKNMHNSFRSFSATKLNNADLATICRVKEIIPIPKADAIESVTVLGWNCVAKKGEFQVGDLCIYFRIATIFPDNYHRVTFLANKPLKTKKLLGTLSQGLVAPLSWLAEDYNVDINVMKEGDDVSEIFQLKKHIPQEEEAQYTTSAFGNGSKKGFARKPFPPYVPKTDEPRIQNIPDMLDHIQDETVIITRKEDGCSATYIYYKDEFLVCGRNFILDKEVDGESKGMGHYFQMAQAFDLENKLKELGRQLAIQGEIVGPRINANRMKLAELDLRVFYMYDIDAQRYLLFDEMMEVCKVLGLRSVPVLYRGLARAMPALCTVPALLEFAGELEYAKKVPAEGCVVRVDCNSLAGNKRSFKAISNKYLLKNEL